MAIDPTTVNPEYIDRAEQFLTGRGFDVATFAHPQNRDYRMGAAVALNLASNLDADECDAMIAAICLRHPWTA